MSGLRVNFSGKEASAEGRSTKILPRGDYHVKLVDGEVRECGPDSKNPGKEYWNLEFVVQTGPYAGSHLWANVMLFEGALYSLVQIMKALGIDVSEGEQEVPDLPELINKDFIVSVTVKKATDDYDERNEIKGYMPFTQDAVQKLSAASAGTKGKGTRSSLLP